MGPPYEATSQNWLHMQDGPTTPLSLDLYKSGPAISAPSHSTHRRRLSAVSANSLPDLRILAPECTYSLAITQKDARNATQPTQPDKTHRSAPQRKAGRLPPNPFQR